MKKVFLTKLFYFSASFSRKSEVHGYNYTLLVRVPFSEKTDENYIEKKIHDSIIQKIHSRDLGRDVDFLKKIKITELNLLRIFFKIIQREIKPNKLVELSLERGRGTFFSISRS